MQKWQEKIQEGMKLMKEGCQATICCDTCPFHKYCREQRQFGAPTNWQIPKNKNYEVTLSYKVLVSDAPDEKEATQRALEHFKTVPQPDNIEIKTTK